MAEIEIRDVGPRDGLQSESPVAPARRAALALALADAGVRHVEAASFVSPKAVPSMAGGDEVVAAAPGRDRRDVVGAGAQRPRRRARTRGRRAPRHRDDLGVRRLQPQERRALDRRGGGRRWSEIGTHGRRSGELDVVVSCAFGSPFDDVDGPTPSADIVDRTLDALPTARITLADTTGTATPRRIAAVLDATRPPPRAPISACTCTTPAARRSSTRSPRSISASTRFDTATGGLGGSPFAPGAGGNLATEDLVLVLDDLGHTTGIDLDAILAIARGLPELVGHPMPSRVSAAGPLPHFES